MSDEYYVAAKGALKLKTDKKVHKKIKRHHRKKTGVEQHPEVGLQGNAGGGGELPATKDNSFRLTKTKTELEFERQKEKRMMETILTKAEKSHKQRIIEFNTSLNEMSEHFDIPKVSWTK